MANLNLDYYSGKDSYSDGDIENVILDIVENDEDFTKYKGTDEFFPILYHLSPERENILNWYPFTKEDNVLEIGAGCGAITGILCRLCGTVTSIELSEKRSKINRIRNGRYDNLEIIVGNYNDIAIEKKFDYVILNGVFEYAISFIDSDRPYEDFLIKAKSLTSHNGKILLAIENRLGVKYFAGDTEDHTNCSFVGLNNYRGNDTVRTFSKAELEDLFRECGLKYWNYYYPYPDYKFPTEIFTDRNVNSEDFGKVYRKYSSQYLSTFDEITMVSALKKEGIMDKFVNSFLVEISLKDEENNQEKIEYVKLNNYRKEKFRIATAIVNNHGVRSVKKYALSDKAIEHIENIYRNQFLNIGKGFIYNQGIREKNAVVQPFLNGNTLDVEVGQYVQDGKPLEIIALIDRICYSLMENAQDISDIYCEDFIRSFGDRRLSTNEKCLINCNIDLIFTNLFREGENIVVVDPEWVFNFAIPFKFVIWRIINECYAAHPQIEQQFSSTSLYEKYEISDEMKEVFYSWAIFFATQYVSNIDFDEFIPDINKVASVFKFVSNSLEIMESSLYIDYGTGYSEVNKKIINTVVNGNKFNSEILLDKSKKIYKLRWDPVEGKYCNCHVEGCTLDGKIIKALPLNADKKDKDLFLNMDPQYEIVIEPGNYSFLKISGTFLNINIEFLDHMINDISDSLIQSENINSGLKGENTSLKDLNHFLEEENKRVLMDYRTLEQDKALCDEEINRLKRENSEISQKEYAYYMESVVLAKEIKEKNVDLHLMEEKYERSQSELNDISILNKELRTELIGISDELRLIKESRAWKLREKIRGIFRGKGNNG